MFPKFQPLESRVTDSVIAIRHAYFISLAFVFQLIHLFYLNAFILERNFVHSTIRKAIVKIGAELRQLRISLSTNSNQSAELCLSQFRNNDLLRHSRQDFFAAILLMDGVHGITLSHGRV